jgi:hypothetical protein
MARPLYNKERWGRLLDPLGRERDGDDPNLWFCTVAELTLATEIYASTVRRFG